MDLAGRVATRCRMQKMFPRTTPVPRFTVIGVSSARSPLPETTFCTVTHTLWCWAGFPQPTHFLHVHGWCWAVYSSLPTFVKKKWFHQICHPFKKNAADKFNSIWVIQCLGSRFAWPGCAFVILGSGAWRVFLSLPTWSLLLGGVWRVFPSLPTNWRQ